MENKIYTIRNHGTEFPASEYQNEIFNCIESGVGNLIINAAAGASKTTTIVNATYYISERKKILFIAFNKDIIEKLRQEITHPKAYISTFHSLGFAILRENDVIKFEESGVNEYKYTAYLNNHINELTSFGETKSLLSQGKVYLNNIKRLIDYTRHYLAFTTKQIAAVAETYGIVPIRDEFEVVNKMLKWGKENLTEIDYTDMIWLPNVLNLTTKKYASDWIFIDEAQDTSIAEQAMVEKCFRRGTRFCTVGDNHQQINVWAGSTEDAIEKFREKPNTKEYKLPISYRCPKRIVELAKGYSDNIEASPNAIDGDILNDVSVFAPEAGDMILCRNVAPLVSLQMLYTKVGKKSFVRGSESIKDDIRSFVEGFKSRNLDKGCLTVDGLYPSIYRLILSEFDKIMKGCGITEEEASKHPTIVRFMEMLDTINVLSEDIFTVDELLERIDKVFNSEDCGAIELSTIHKAKGLEADNVFIYKPSLMPSVYSTKPWEIESEKNLIYVAYTRAKKTLNFIKEDDQGKRKFVCGKLLLPKIYEMMTKIAFSDSVGAKDKEMLLIVSNDKNGDTVVPNRTRRSKAGATKMMNIFS